MPHEPDDSEKRHRTGIEAADSGSEGSGISLILRLDAPQSTSVSIVPVGIDAIVSDPDPGLARRGLIAWLSSRWRHFRCQAYLRSAGDARDPATGKIAETIILEWYLSHHPHLVGPFGYFLVFPHAKHPHRNASTIKELPCKHR